MGKQEIWWKRDGGRYTCEDCGFSCSDEAPARMLDHLVGHRDDDGERVSAGALNHFVGLLSYDEKCGELARQFLVDYPGAKKWHEALLSQAIQDAVESWLEDEKGSGALKGEKARADAQ